MGPGGKERAPSPSRRGSLKFRHWHVRPRARPQYPFSSLFRMHRLRANIYYRCRVEISGAVAVSLVAGSYVRLEEDLCRQRTIPIDTSNARFPELKTTRPNTSETHCYSVVYVQQRRRFTGQAETPHLYAVSYVNPANALR